ncbi:YcxB family protein [Paracandidimonas soli]|uniref:YcxB-like protein n=2 Tax=Paracandidimonas soli TaxID=1917182 RepID=A0A4R3UPP2_9BURK|nr:YcxB family protein [Paracandidimonas soli]TCU93735.1 hypothetical protein EV686_11187 [Paracandidimonas soli]
MGGDAAAEPPEAFTIAAPIDLQDRIAAALFTYSDLFAAARRRLLYILGWVVPVLLAMTGFSSWQEGDRQDISAFVSRFAADLLGLGGLPILVVVVPVLLYYAIQPTLVRSRLKRWYRDERLDQPISATYRFEPGGITVFLPGRRTVLACSRISGVAETTTHLFIQLKDIEDVLTLPLRLLSGEQIAHIKAWAASCHAGAVGAAHSLPEQEAPPDRPPLLSTRFQLTEEDRAVALGWQMERPGMWRRRRRGFILAFLATALIVPLIFGFLWLLDPVRVPLRYALPLFVEMFATTFWQYVLGFWALIAVIIVLHPWARRRHARQLARQIQKRVQAYEYEVRLYDDRLEVWQDGWRNSFETASLEGIERRDEHFILLRKEDEPLILPLRALDGDKLSIFERAIARRIGGENHRPEART